MSAIDPPIPADLFSVPSRPRPSEHVYSDTVPVHTHASASEQDGAIAAAAFVKRLRVQVLAQARAAGPYGVTVKEVVRTYLTDRSNPYEDAGTLRNCIGPRLSELKHAGLVYLDSKQRRERCGAYIAVAGREDEDGSTVLRVPPAVDRGDE